MTASPRAWAELVNRPPGRRRLPTSEIRIEGARDRVAELVGVLAPAAHAGGEAAAVLPS